MLKIHNLKDRICGHRDNGGHATEIPAGARLLFCNGQVGSLQDGTVPNDVSEQVDIIFDRIAHILEAGRMSFSDIAKVSVYVTDAKYLDDYYEARPRYMGDHNPPTVLLVVGPFPRPGVQMEVEVLAAKVD